MKKYILTSAAALFLFSGVAMAQIDMNAMPKPGPTPTLNINQPKTFRLANGLTVMIVENHKLPHVTMNLSMDMPPILEGDKAGISEIMAEQLGNGTKTISKDEFNKKVDFLGANLNFSAHGASAGTLSKYFSQVIKLMADAVVNPKFDESEIQKSKDRMMEGLKSQEKNASAIASKVYNALQYGKNTARGEFESEQTIKNITTADVNNYYQKYYSPDNAYLVIVGDVNYADAKKLVEQGFSSWKKSGIVYPKLEPANNPKTTEIAVVDVPSAVQSVIKVGNLTDLRMNSKDYFASILGNYILGDGSEARLFMNLREKNAFTYGAYSRLSTGKYSPDFSAQASVRNEVADKAVKEFLYELNRISTITPEELTAAKAKLKGEFIMSMEKPETIARLALMQKTQGLPADFYTNYLKSIDAVTAAEVSSAVKRNILGGQSRILVAGKGAEISDKLEALGYPVKYYDRDANPAIKVEIKKVDGMVTAANVLDNYYKAIGGKDAMAKITSISTDASATVQGMNLDMKIINAKGSKIVQTLSMMGNTVQKTVFDGKDGYMELQGQKMPMPAEAKAEYLKKTELFPELNFKNPNIVGIEKYNGEDTYVIKESDNTYYYNVKTGLKMGDIQNIKMAGKSNSIPTNYSDYKVVSGVMMPYTISQNMMGQDIVFNVKSYQVNQAKDTDFK